MRTRISGRPSRRLIALLVAITVVPLVSLLWLGHYLLEEDRRAAVLQELQRLARVVDQIAAALDNAVAADEQKVAAGAGDWPAGAVLVTFTSNQIEVLPPGRVAFHPITPSRPEAARALFDPVDAAEFQRKDPTLTLDLLEELARSADPVVSATARLRLARTLEGQGEIDRAVQIYRPLAGIDDIAISEAPIGLVAQYRLCRALASMDRASALQMEARDLHHKLVSGHWALSAPMFAVYLKDADAWIKDPDVHPAREERLASAVAALWRRKSQRTSELSAAPERFTIESAGEHYSVLWQPHAGQVRALVAAPEYARSVWMANAAPMAREQQLDVRLPLLGDVVPPEVETIEVLATATRLPWNVAFSPSRARTPVSSTTRRVPLVIGLAVLITMALGASYFIARAVHREIAVARMQSDFVAAVSHEFRTPLTTLRQFTDMLKDGRTAGEAERQLSYDAQSRATDRLTRLVESVLDFGSMEAGKRRYQFEAVNVAALVRAVVSDFQREVQATGYRFECRADESIGLDADAEALGRALRNLLENAVKYSPEERTVDVTVAKRGHRIAIAVRDRGIGVAPGERKAIFDQFHRGAEARRRGIPGTGIGLAIVDHIVRAHGGSVEIESEPGHGSTFTMMLRAAAPEGTAGAAAFDAPELANSRSAK